MPAAALYAMRQADADHCVHPGSFGDREDPRVHRRADAGPPGASGTRAPAGGVGVRPQSRVRRLAGDGSEGGADGRRLGLSSRDGDWGSGVGPDGGGKRGVTLANRRTWAVQACDGTQPRGIGRAGGAPAAERGSREGLREHAGSEMVLWNLLSSRSHPACRQHHYITSSELLVTRSYPGGVLTKITAIPPRGVRDITHARGAKEKGSFVAKQAAELKYAVRFSCGLQVFRSTLPRARRADAGAVVMSLIFGETYITLRYVVVLFGLSAAWAWGRPGSGSFQCAGQ